MELILVSIMALQIFRGNPLLDRVPSVYIDSEYVVTSVVDVTPPSILAIERSNPIEQNTNRQTLVYKVTFSEDRDRRGRV